MAARKDYGGNDIVSCVIDTEKEIFSVTARKTIVDEGDGSLYRNFKGRCGGYRPLRHLSTAL